MIIFPRSRGAYVALALSLLFAAGATNHLGLRHAAAQTADAAADQADTAQAEPTNATTDATTVRVGALEISGSFARAMLPGAKVAGGYMTIRNGGTTRDRLIAVTSPTAETVAVHTMEMDGDIMRMRPVEGGLEIPVGEEIQLMPGSLHLMFETVEKPFRQDTSVPVTLSFEKAGDVDVALPVMAPNAMGPGGAN